MRRTPTYVRVVMHVRTEVKHDPKNNGHGTAREPLSPVGRGCRDTASPSKWPEGLVAFSSSQRLVGRAPPACHVARSSRVRLTISSKPVGIPRGTTRSTAPCRDRVPRHPRCRFPLRGAHRGVWKLSRAILDTESLAYCPVVRLELALLHKIGRISATADEILGALAAEQAVLPAEDPMTSVVGQPVVLTWTRDPFDRMIVAHAALREATLLSRDRQILKHYARAVW